MFAVSTSNSTMRFAVSILITAAYLLLDAAHPLSAAISNTDDGEASLRRFNSLFKGSMQFDTFVLVSGSEKTRLRVPPQFIDRATIGTATTGDELSLKFFWPTLQPAPAGLADTKDILAFSQGISELRSGTFLSITYRQEHASRMQDIIRHHMSHDWVIDLDGRQPGFRNFTDKLSRANLPPPLRNDFLIPDRQDPAAPIYIQCPVKADLPPEHLYCIGHNYVGHNVYSEFLFSYAHLSEWRSVDHVTREVFSSIEEKLP